MSQEKKPKLTLDKEYNVTLTFDNLLDAQKFAADVMSRRQPKGTKSVFRVMENYPK